MNQPANQPAAGQPTNTEKESASRVRLRPVPRPPLVAPSRRPPAHPLKPSPSPPPQRSPLLCEGGGGLLRERTRIGVPLGYRPSTTAQNGDAPAWDACVRRAVPMTPHSPLAGRVRGAHGARGCQRPGRHLGRGRRLGLRRHLTPSGRREVTPSRVSTQPRSRSTRSRSFRAGWIRQLTRPETLQTCRNLRGTHCPSTQRRQKRTTAHKVVVQSVSSSSLCVTAPAPALHPNPYLQALHPPPLTHFQTLPAADRPHVTHRLSVGALPN